MILHRSPNCVVSTDGDLVVLRTRPELHRSRRVKRTEFQAGALDGAILESAGIFELVEAHARDRIRDGGVRVPHVSPLMAHDGRVPVLRRWEPTRDEPEGVFIEGRTVVIFHGPTLSFDEFLANGFPEAWREKHAWLQDQVRATVLALSPLECFCQTGAESAREHGTIDPLASVQTPDYVGEAGSCSVCGYGWSFWANRGGTRVMAARPFDPALPISDADVEGALAGIRAGVEVVLGGSRQHTSFKTNAAGELVREDFDEGASDETPCDKDQIRRAMGGNADAFIGALTALPRLRLFEALVGAQAFPDGAVNEAAADLFAFGEPSTRTDIFDAFIGGKPFEPSLLEGMTDLDAFNAVIAPLGFQRGPALDAFRRRFFAQLRATLGDRIAKDPAAALDRALGPMLADPTDDAPRLVLADALLERGDSRGELIATQCRAATLDADDPERSVLEARALQLVSQWGSTWAGIPGATFARGFVDSVTIRWTEFADRADAIFALAPPIRELRFVNHRDDTLEEPEAVLADPRLAAIRALDLSKPVFAVTNPESEVNGTIDTPFGARLIPALEASSNLRELTMRHSHLQPADIERIGKLPHLERLDFERNPGGALFSAGMGTELRSLNVADCHIRPEGMSALAHALAKQTKLEELNLRYNGFDALIGSVVASLPLRRLTLAQNELLDDGAALLRGMTSLRSLNVAECEIGNRGVTALAGLPLSSLDLKNNLFDEEAVRVLAVGPIARTIRRLSLGTEIGSYIAFKSWAENPNNGRKAKLGRSVVRRFGAMPNLWDLDLCGCGIDGDAAVSLLEALPALRALRLGQCAIDDGGLGKLVAHPGFARLETLDLSKNRIGPAGAKLLAAAPRLPTHLILSRNELGEDGGRALATIPEGNRLVQLELIECKIGDEGGMALVNAPSLSTLALLRLDLNGIGYERKQLPLWHPLRDRVTW